MKIFVGNLAASVEDEELKALFEQHGKVSSVKIIRDMFSRVSKGFGFVEMPGKADSQKAIDSLNTLDLKGKRISVNEARPEKPRGRRRY
jgi:RNA recognition motif-containing protein